MGRVLKDDGESLRAMFCRHCKVLVLEGERCGQCGQTIDLFKPPPGAFQKKAELRYESGRLSAQEIGGPEFLAYVADERAKIQRSRELLAGDENSELFLQGLATWEKSLAMVDQWLELRTELFLQSALALATQADEQLEQGVHFQWERNRDWLLGEQRRLQLEQQRSQTKRTQLFQESPDLSGDFPALE